MNLSTAVFLLKNSAARAVLVTYEPDTTSRKQDRVMYKTFDASIKKGDMVVVPTDTRHNLTVCQVDAVDVDVDFDSNTQVAWIVGKIDMADVNSIKAQEDNIINIIKAAEKNKKKLELQASMEALVTASGGNPALLSFVTPPTETTPIPAPPAAVSAAEVA